MNSNLNTNAITNTKNTSSVEQNKRQDKIVICDDDKDIVRALEIYLSNRDYELLSAYTGREALDYVKKGDISLVLLDIMMPEMDGITALRAIREKSNVPVILITAKSEDADKVLGLDVGADDYITKPFNPLEVVARVKTQLRRYKRYNQVQEVKEIMEYDIRGLIINKETHKCYLYNELLDLTPIEFDILWYLCSQQGKVVSSEELFEAVWKEKYINNNNTVMALIARLREKLKESTKKPKLIKTVWGVGYQIEK